MSNYTDKEFSAYGGTPIEGYRFVGPNSTEYRYTSTERDVTINGLLYSATDPVARTAIRTGTQEDDNLYVDITLPIDVQVVQDYAFDVSPAYLTLTIYRYHEGTDPAADWVIIWKGPVKSFSVTGKEARARVASLFSTLLQCEVPNRYYQFPCNHVLYDPRCKISDVAFKTTTTVSTIVDATALTVADDGFADSYLTAGEIIRVSTGERRTIVDNVANQITYVFPFHNIQAGDSVQLRAGCDHSFVTCGSKFSNQVNYGGFPYIGDNPFEGQL